MLPVIVGIPGEGLEPGVTDIAAGDPDAQLLALVPEAAVRIDLDVKRNDLAGSKLFGSVKRLDRRTVRFDRSPGFLYSGSVRIR